MLRRVAHAPQAAIVLAAASFLAGGLCRAAPAAPADGPTGDQIPPTVLTPAVRQAVANGAAALVSRILAPGNTYKLAFPPAQTLVTRVVEIEKIPAKRVSQEQPVWEHEYGEVEKLVPIIESGQPTGRFQKVKQRVVVKSKQVGTTTRTVLVPDPYGTETIERPKTVREPGGPAAWAPNLPGLNGMALYVLAKAGLAKHPATVKHAAALASHADLLKGLPDSTFDVAWMAVGFTALGPESPHAPIAERLLGKLIDGQVREGKIDGLWGPVCANTVHFVRLFNVNQKVREELDVNIPKLLAAANPVQAKQIVATGEAMRALATAYERTHRDVFRAGMRLKELQGPLGIAETDTVPGVPFNTFQWLVTDLESTEAAAFALAEAQRAGMLPAETERIAIKGKKVHPPSKTDAVLKAAARRLAETLDEAGCPTGLVQVVANNSLDKTGFPVALVTTDDAPPTLFDAATASTSVAAQAAVEWLAEADPDLVKVLDPARKATRERAKRIAARWFAESAVPTAPVWQGVYQATTVSHADLKKSATVPAPAKAADVDALPMGPAGCLYRLVPGFRGLFTDKTTAKDRLADGLFRQIAYRLVVLQDQNGQWSSPGNQFLSSALEALNIARAANDQHAALNRGPGKINLPDPLPYELLLALRLPQVMPSGAVHPDGAAFATLASLVFLVDGLEKPVSLEGIPIHPTAATEPPKEPGDAAPPPVPWAAPQDAARSVPRPNSALQPLVETVTAATNSRITLAPSPADAGQPGKPPATPVPVKKPDGEDDVGTFDDLLTPGAGK
ncbi:hypothetical protein LBMAG47_23290 [Planctomycetia bacterium]|nr:hypothetical protein LBMAG47_23290 [Planctomycetia bacterium]